MGRRLARCRNVLNQNAFSRFSNKRGNSDETKHGFASGTGSVSEAGADEDFGDRLDRAVGPDVKQQDLMKDQTQSGVLTQPLPAR